ncbi:uncharacterized protein LOC113227201 [Hyposmocoma kahamanoa]|uniref:uncharacterized protein LOC113227201 n=1 Tax=Hyposmocoma kahamanoa TaxID=1477025 RepID=UPI000E6D9493|nr:uncharacterized protein LOC113227201 [Hyposmocoma kahamanoa]
MSRVHRCLVDSCSSTSETANLYRWPRSVDLERVWINLLRSHSSRLTSSLTHRNRIHRHAYVCKLHFEAVRTVGDHAYAVPLQINAELVTRKTKRTTEHRPHTQYSTYRLTKIKVTLLSLTCSMV